MLASLANVAVAEADYEGAMRGYEEARVLLGELGDTKRLAQVVANMGDVAAILGRLELGRSLTEEALALQREVGNTEAATVSLHNLGRIELRSGRPAAAAALFRECFDSALELDYRELIAYCVQAAAELAVPDDPVRAARLLGAADGLFEALGVIRLGGEAESYDEAVAALGRELGADGLERESAAGRATGEGEAVADALALLEDVRGR